MQTIVEKNEFDHIINERYNFKAGLKLSKSKLKLYELCEKTGFKLSFWYDRTEAPLFWDKEKEFIPKFCTCVNIIHKDGTFLMTAANETLQENIDYCIEFLKTRGGI